MPSFGNSRKDHPFALRSDFIERLDEVGLVEGRGVGGSSFPGRITTNGIGNADNRKKALVVLRRRRATSWRSFHALKADNPFLNSCQLGPNGSKCDC